MPTPSAAAHPRGGFTLFEVLAAIVIFGLAFTMLAQGAMQGLSAEGEASRRLRASLLADRLLGELEGQMAAGAAPPLGLTEDEVEEFSTEIEVRPYDFAIHLASATVPDYITEETRGQRPLPLLEPPNRGTPVLLQLDVRVRWLEGVFERVVTRSTFGLDPVALEPLIASLVEASEDGESDEDDEDEDDGDGDSAGSGGGRPGSSIGPGGGGPGTPNQPGGNSPFGDGSR
jgi:prepilin-type N-terminal cleavage/methylation domain-containing protein